MKSLSDVEFEELKDKNFELISIVEMLCEFCQKPLNAKSKFLRRIQISTKEDFSNFVNRASIHDRVEIDIDKCKIYLYDHDFPGDIHPECIEKL